MSVQGVADKVAELLKEGTQEFVMCNFAPPDMVCLARAHLFRVLADFLEQVGHTGSYDAATKGIHATDQAVKTIWEAALGNGSALSPLISVALLTLGPRYILLVTADHGNAEQMKDQKTGAPHTAHTCNRVPFIIAGKGVGSGGYGFKVHHHTSLELPPFTFS